MDEREKEYLGRLSVSQLRGRYFTIPYYQRGYRWQRENIEALLDDLYDFANGSSTLYCLQPLVLKYDASHDRWRVVDGQQRLTTITLICQALEEIDVSWKLHYEHENRTLDDLLTKDTDRSINADFRREALKTIRDWAKSDPSKKECLRKLLRGELDKSVAFIEYRVPVNVIEQDVFERLNTGKIPLTSSELIKALFMVESSGLSEHEKIEISKEWESIESDLRSNRFWSIFNTDNYQSFTRIDLLFGMVGDVGVGRLKSDRLAIYHAIEHYVRFEQKNGSLLRLDKRGRATRLRKVWGEVLQRFWWMKSCHNDIGVYNYLGWLARFTEYQPKSLFDIYEQWRVETESGDRSPIEMVLGKFECFRLSIARIIAVIVKEAFPDGIIGVEYSERNREPLRKLFVLLNVEFCTKRNERFRFDLYRAEEGKWHKSESESGRFRGGWDIEHIDAKSVATIQDENNLKNLVLLDAKTNREYKAACFSVKRDYIRRNMGDPDFYVLPCTQCAFMKFFSDSGDNSRWSDADGESYRTAMIDLYEDFMWYCYGKRNQDTGKLALRKEVGK